jgi:hypothetical protein
MSQVTEVTQVEKELTLDQFQKLDSYASEINGLLRSTLLSAVRIGEILKDVRDNILPYGEWIPWVESQFESSITCNTATNFINLYNLHSKYADKYARGLEALSLSSLYIISRHNVDEEIQQAVLEIAEEQEEAPPSREEVRNLVQSYRQIKMSEAGLSDEIQTALLESPVVEDPKEVNALKRLSKARQLEVAERLAVGVASTTKEAVKQIYQEKKAASDVSESTKKEQSVEVVYEKMKRQTFRQLSDVPSESVDLAFVEAPLKLAYTQNDLHSLCIELERVLVPSAFAVITVGHKAAMFAGPLIDPLKPVHLLCLRRQPGQTRSIVGLNIMSASVFALFCYKAPYSPPGKMLADLHTYEVTTNSEAIAGLDEVYSGLEKCIERIFTPLIAPGGTLLHALVSPMHFNLSSSVHETAEKLSVGTVYTVR